MRILKFIIGTFMSAIILLTPQMSQAATIEGAVSGLSIPNEFSALNINQQRELKCLAINIYHEARGSTREDMYAVGFATRNRVNSSQSSYCEVIWQPNQFSWTKRPAVALKPNNGVLWLSILEIAYDVMVNERPDTTSGARHFYSVRIATPPWAASKSKIRIGGHYYTR